MLYTISWHFYRCRCKYLDDEILNVDANAKRFNKLLATFNETGIKEGELVPTYKSGKIVSFYYKKKTKKNELY
jgi:hypothetical protein